jgi:hypothetical protein
MKFSPFLFFSAVLTALTFSSCAMKEPDAVEAYLIKQDAEMKKSIKRSRDRARAREDHWSAYSSRADSSYNRWIDSVMR